MADQTDNLTLNEDKLDYEADEGINLLAINYFFLSNSRNLKR